MKKTSEDGAYDGLSCRKIFHEKDIQEVIPPPNNAVFRQEKEMARRNNFLTVWKWLGGDKKARKITKKLFCYHRRSLVETTFSRLKKIFGGKFQSESWENLCSEAHLKFWILNRMISS